MKPDCSRAVAATRRVQQTVDLLALHEQHPDRYPFYLDSSARSVTATEKKAGNSRFDILFAFPGQRLELTAGGQLQGIGSLDSNDFLSQLDSCWQNAGRSQQTNPALPFSGGWFLYLGYELAGQIEPRLELPLPAANLPMACAIRIPAAVIYDHQETVTWLVAEAGQETLLDRMAADLADIQELVPVSLPAQVSMQEAPAETYLAQVAKVKQYISDGDVFQVNLSRAWQGRLPVEASPIQIYRQLRKTNPAPFAGLARFPQGMILSSSPERLVRVQGQQVETRPIAGTRPRGKGNTHDTAFAKELMRHPKERAEHVMLIDLERNDLGRVCIPGSIRVDEMMALESYAHVHHIVSNVSGRLRDAVSPGQVLRAVFPGGTITGCPKERCMAIIAELEQEARGPYTGSMGYLNHDGSMDMNILIRTIVIEGTQVSLRAGAGLVADSDADFELVETRAKAKGMLLALDAIADD